MRDCRNDLRVLFAPSIRRTAILACWSESMTIKGNQEESRKNDRGFNLIHRTGALYIVVCNPSTAAMASIHYGTPSSLPSDYAILSRYANRDESPDDNDSNDFQDDTHPHARPIAPRTSFPFPYLKPLQPKLPEHLNSKVTVPDEYTPLLVPRIEEEGSTSNDPTRSPSTAKVCGDELRILLKYTLPVLGYALQFHVAFDFCS